MKTALRNSITLAAAILAGSTLGCGGPLEQETTQDELETIGAAPFVRSPWAGSSWSPRSRW